MKTIYFLDRNIISKINQQFSKNNLPPNLKRILRKIDKESNFISALSSIQEGEHGFLETEQELVITAKKEANIIKRFFKNAKVDSKFIVEFVDFLAYAFEDNNQIKWKRYSRFLSEMNDILNQQKSKKEQKKYKEIIISKALEYNIDLGHPVFQSVLSLLYGSRDSLKILKFKSFQDEEIKQKNIYNALNDLSVINMLSMVEIKLKEQNKHQIKVEFITFDQYLKNFLNSITFKGIKISNGITSTEIIYKKELFPDLSEEEFILLQKEIIERNKFNKTLEEK